MFFWQVKVNLCCILKSQGLLKNFLIMELMLLSTPNAVFFDEKKMEMMLPCLNGQGLPFNPEILKSIKKSIEEKVMTSKRATENLKRAAAFKQKNKLNVTLEFSRFFFLKISIIILAKRLHGQGTRADILS